MFIDARHLADGSIVTAEICVVGSGPAGITVASEMARAGHDVVMLEAGGKRFDRSAQELYRGEVLDQVRHGALEKYRQRRFGGTSTVWGGRCAPFDPIDFEQRDYVPDSGWPIGRTDLDPYYVRAHEFCHLGAYTYSAAEALPDGPREMVPGFTPQDVRTDFIWRFSLPTDFGKEFTEPLQQSGRVRVYLHANCLKLAASESGSDIHCLEVASTPEKRFRVRARYYVLATGGLEVTRLLLVSDDVHSTGLGNSQDLAGRYYMSHMTGDLGEVLFTPKGSPLVWEYERTVDGVYCRRAFSIGPERQRAEGLRNFRAILSHPPIADPAHRNGILSSMYLIKRYLAHRIPPEYSKALAGTAPLLHVSAHSMNVARDLGKLAGFSAYWLRKRIIPKRKLPSVSFESRSNVYTLHFDAEQSPRFDSRVLLSDSRDEFGMRRLKVDWRFGSADIDSVLRNCALIGDALRKSGTGKLLFEPDRMCGEIGAQSGVGSHHIGTTRMAASPHKGVVDQDCRVHGVSNLFIASSSVFPTSSFANPTLTIVALAARLGAHLSGQLARQTQKEDLAYAHVG